MASFQGLTLGVGGHHAVKRAGQAGSKALALTHNAFHSAKLHVVSFHEFGHAVFQFDKIVFVLGDAGGGAL